jgi:hypothetical protein
MSNLDPKFTRVSYHDRNRDFSILTRDESHVRLFKLFPLCAAKKVSENDYRRFHLRYYIPRDIFDDKTRKIDKIIIMFNGLDEVDYFTLYDQLGQGLAKYGYASVLLPLPNHLNRNPKFRFNDPDKEERPSKMLLEERDKIFDIYKQVLGELKTLIKHIGGKCRHQTEGRECGFYDHMFSPDVSISLLGYSLGGLVALCGFLVNRDLISTCIMLNSGAKLDDIDVSDFIPIEDWKDMVAGIQKDWAIPASKSMEARLFEKVFLGKSTSLLKMDLKEVSRRVCFIIGGADSVTKYKSIQDIEPDEHGVATLKLPGISHFVSLDMQWNKWFRLVVNTIAQFDDSANRETLTHSQIIDELMYYQGKYGVFQCPQKSCIDNISDESDKRNFHRVLYAAEGCYGSVNVAVIEMFMALHRMTPRPKLYPGVKNFPYKSLFGQRAAAACSVDDQTIYKMLQLQLKAAAPNICCSMIFTRAFVV